METQEEVPTAVPTLIAELGRENSIRLFGTVIAEREARVRVLKTEAAANRSRVVMYWCFGVAAIIGALPAGIIIVVL